MLNRSTLRSTVPSCPRCGATEALRIVYGLPTNEAVAAAERGEFRLGGCVIDEESAEFECGGCGVALPWVADA